MPHTLGRFLLPTLLVALLAGVLFTPGLPGAFVFDDLPNIVNDENLKLTELSTEALVNVVTSPQRSGTLRMLPTLSFAIDHWRAGSMDPATFKITNIIIHAVTALVLAWFFRSLLLMTGVSARRVVWIAPALALAWAIHPLQVSSVLYVVQRMQTMGTLFLVLALWAYLQARQAQVTGRPGRTGFLLAVLCWAIALGCKEDSVLLPAYALALELTVLRFAAADAQLARRLRIGYLLAVLAGLAAFVLVIVPSHWSPDTLAHRNFSTPERLLTQGRVLCMYLWQIVWPLPQQMPFYYDWLQPSRSLLQPWTTLPAIAVLLALLASAWRLRTTLPLFSLGVLLFFAAHSITSNVIALELAFEHRNHFALIGAVLAIGSLLAAAFRRIDIKPLVQAGACIFLLVALSTATLLRAHSWRSSLSLAEANAQHAPLSARAQIALCAEYFEVGGGVTPNNPRLDDAIASCEAGTTAAPESLNNPALLIVLKTLRGDITQADWDLFQQRLQAVHMTWDNRRAPNILIYHFRKGVALDKRELLKVLDTLIERAPPSEEPFSMVSRGYFVLNDLGEPDLAMPYFIRAIEAAAPQDPFPQQLAGELRDKGRPDLAEKVERAGLSRRGAPRASGSNQ
ncbi:hypothetical protein [Pseudoxanthomonas sp. PXM01]|uniref:hypothetical protein n=1 Tax=Pseudoxanthomonas sp. PXM01 TaxID=2769295 RepID=UPI001781DCCC|nr:hypothetical protein [Pseudoxanthomonas sp. PXM01]MBD9469954.1 hypothetical protein [Pseudoxanthomonas sp. PXM01]